MITEDYVSFEIAKLLKEKGFESDECIAIYDLGDNNAFIRDSGIFENGPEDYLEFQWGEEWKRFGYYLAPTLQMAMKWLRKEKRCIIVPNPTLFSADGCKQWSFSIWADDNLEVDGENPAKRTEYDSYEKSCEAAIRYCLQNLI